MPQQPLSTQPYETWTPGQYGKPVDSDAANAPLQLNQPQEFMQLPSQNSGLLDALAHLDRGLDAREKLIDALKAQLSKSAALPKTAPLSAPEQLELQPPESNDFVQLDSLPAAPALEYSSSTVSRTCAAGFQAAGQLNAQWPSGTVNLTGTNSNAGPPPPKRLRVANDSNEYSNAALAESACASSSTPFQASSQPAADEAALAARKAEMLRNLQAAEKIGQPGTSAPSAVVPEMGAMPAHDVTSQSTAGSAATHQVAGSTQACLPPGGASASGVSNGAAVTCPPGTSPEEFEEYRKRCWQQYYEYCTVWQKYFTQQQGHGQAKAGQLAPQSKHPSPPAPPATFRAPAPPPLTRSVQGATMTAGGISARPVLSQSDAIAGRGPPGRLPERSAVPSQEDIHNRLLGL